MEAVRVVAQRPDLSSEHDRTTLADGELSLLQKGEAAEFTTPEPPHLPLWPFESSKFLFLRESLSANAADRYRWVTSTFP